MTTRSVVVQDGPRARKLRWLAAGGWVLLGFVAGNLIASSGLFGSYIFTENYFSLKERVAIQAQQLDELHQLRADYESRARINVQALEKVRQKMADQQETAAELERGIRFYKSLMAPNELMEGLTIRSVDVSPKGDGDLYPFRVLVQQSSSKHQLVVGTLNVSLAGRQGDKPAEYNLAELSEQISKVHIRLRCKYFQAIDGYLRLPQGFVPQEVRVLAKSTKPKPGEVSAEFPWPKHEEVSYVEE